MKKLLKRIVTMAMAATMVAGLSSVAMAGEKVGEKTIYVQFDASAEAINGADGVVMNAWNAGTDFGGAGAQATTATAFAGWGDKPFEMEKVSDGIYKLPVVAYDDGTAESGALVALYVAGAEDNKGIFKIENTDLLSNAIKNADSKAITLVAKVDGENWVLEVKDNYDPTAKTDDKKTDDAKTDDKKDDAKADEKKADDTKTEETKTDDTKVDAQGNDVSPKTGDMAPIATAAVLGVVSLAGVAIALRKKAA
ncbi:MAG: hypothetical protein K6G26_07620 [Lachnospiraceae bacterium]|nr:hypothetical protein [Lachnospiraceae bacterium]